MLPSPISTLQRDRGIFKRKLLHVNFTTASKNPDWVLDGVSMLRYIKPGSDPNGRREKPLIFSFGPTFERSQQAVIDNEVVLKAVTLSYESLDDVFLRLN